MIFMNHNFQKGRLRAGKEFSMIYATFDNLHRYLGISANLDTAIRFITTQDLTLLHNGRNEIDGDNVFVNVFEFDTIPEESGMWEAHVQYADIHVDITGFEKIGVTDMAYLTETCRKEEEDFVGCEGPVKTWVPITSRTALVVFPEDAHMVKIQNGESAHVRKAVFKVKV